MNQILENEKSKSKNKKKYKTQFIISFLFIIFILFFYLYKQYYELNYLKISNVANRTYNISYLYSNNLTSHLTTNETEISVIGTIKIPMLNLSYPIFSEYSDELLKISVCKFYGPNVNSLGNLCIIGHNYNNGTFFSNLYKLNINDIIDIYDTNLNVISYTVYKIFEVEADDLSYLDQNTNRTKAYNFSYM